MKNMDYDEMEQKKQKFERWLKLGRYVAVGLVVVAKVTLVFWRIMSANL